MKRREFLLGESVNGWYIKELGTKDFEPTTFLDSSCIRVKQVLPGEDEMIKELVEALEKYTKITYEFGMVFCPSSLSAIEALDKYKKWLGEK